MSSLVKKRLGSALTEEQKEETKKVMERIIKIFGTSRNLAAELGVRENTVCEWLKGRIIPSAVSAMELEYVSRKKIEEMQKLEITKEKLRPDIFKKES